MLLPVISDRANLTAFSLQTAGGILLPETGKKLNEGEVGTLSWVHL